VAMTINVPTQVDNDRIMNAISREASTVNGKPRTIMPLEEEILSAKTQPVLGVVVSLFIISLLISYFAYDSMPVYAWASWFAAMMMTIVARIVVQKRLTVEQSISIQKRMKYAVGLNAVIGIVQASSFLFFPSFSFTEKMIQSMIMLGLTNGSISTNSGYKPLFLAHSIPVITALTLAWSLSPHNDVSMISQIGVATLNLVYFAVQYANASNHFRLFKQSYEIREQQTSLNAELKEKNAKLDAALSSAVQARQEADQANTSKTRFLASASHDLRQPTHALSLLAGVLSNRPLDKKSKAIASDIHTASQSLQSLMSGLLDISKLDAGLMEPKIEIVDLHWLVSRVCSEFETDCKNKGLRLILNSRSRDAVTRGDPQLTERILSNLISNAVKYTDEGRIEVILEEINDEWKVSIKDTGHGIKQDEQKHIFDEFYQIGNDHRDRSNGLGLGLAIVKRLSDVLDVNLGFESELDTGSTFWFSLPKINEKTQSREDLDQLNVLAGLHVLCVDDEADIRNALALAFEVLGCSFDLVECTQAAVEAAKHKRPDIVLADFRLKGDDNGIKTIDMIREIYPGIPSLLVTGDTSPERLQHASKVSIEMLHKPLTMEKLAQSVGEAVAKQQ
jgi:signal transduction histidine kinase/CheY-like chemotaxis protein